MELLNGAYNEIVNPLLSAVKEKVLRTLCQVINSLCNLIKAISILQSMINTNLILREFYHGMHDQGGNLTHVQIHFAFILDHVFLPLIINTNRIILPLVRFPNNNKCISF